MAQKKKPRTPTPPRRVQAPKQRTSSSPSVADAGMRQRQILYGVAGSGIVALVAVVAFIALGGGSSSAKAAAQKITAAGCRYRHYPALPRTPHYTTLNPSPPPHWNSFPPTSGRHYFQPVLFGIYTQPLPEIRLVHNLEHGAVILQYGDKVPRAQVAAITQWYQQDANAIVVAPLPSLGAKVALTSWTQWAECSGFQRKAADAFRNAFRYNAPEKFPKHPYLDPGN